MKRVLEAFFIVLLFFGLMKIVDFVLQRYINQIAVQNILAVVGAFISLILSAWLSEKIVALIKRHL